MTFLSLWRWQRWTSACSPKTSLIARRSALPPSITNKIACSGSRPRSTRSASSVRASVAFSVEPSHSPSGDLHALRRDPERDDVRRVGDFHAIEHHHRQPNVIESATHQLLKRGRGALDDHFGRRRLRGGGARDLDLAADGLADPRELPRRDAGEHAVHHGPSERVAVGEVLVSPDEQLVLILGGAHPRPAHLHASAAERHRAVLVACRLAVRSRL